MRVTRSLLLLLAATMVAAGCARQPVAQVPVAVAPGLAAPAAPSIDSTVYGPIGVAPARVAVVAPAPAGRGLIMATSGPPALTIAAKPLAYAPSAQEGPYTLDSGDRLRVVVFGQDGLSNSYVVGASGYIAMPLIGTVLARGATTEQLSGRIADKLRQGFVRDPHVAVEIEAYRPFFILGEVTQPGQYPYVADMTVETAVAIAGGFGPRAFRKTATITRNVNGQQVRFTVPVTYAVRPGDTINVQERWF